MAINSEELLRGVCVIIDDDVRIKDTDACLLYEDIQNSGLPIVAYERIPENAIDSFHNISFMILDWNFQQTLDLPQEVSMGAEATKDLQENALSFLTQITDMYFIPVFILTGQEVDAVSAQLIEADLLKEGVPNRIKICKKEDIKNYSDFCRCAQEWLEKTPSALALKIWENEVSVSKHKMFNELYKASPQWVKAIKDCLDEDAKHNEEVVNQEFQELLNNHLVNRMNYGKYSSIAFDEEGSIKSSEIKRVLEGGRFIRYGENTPDISYLGDVYYNSKENEYYLNIRAQCDLVRCKNPLLYLLSGKEITPLSIAQGQQKIRFIHNPDGSISIRTHEKIINIQASEKFDLTQINEINELLESEEKAIVYSYGEILSKKNEVFVPCIDNKDLLRFSYRTIAIEKKNIIESKAKRIGRLISPYIIKIQQEFSAYMIRTGIMPLPRQLFFNEKEG